MAAIGAVPTTLASDRLFRWAATPGRQEAVVEALFHAYCLGGGDIGDHEVLVEIAGAAGMDAALVKGLYAEGRDKELVAQDVIGAQQMGIRGVPFFIIDFKYKVSGAQTPEVFVDVIKKALDEAEGGEGEGEEVETKVEAEAP